MCWTFKDRQIFQRMVFRGVGRLHVGDKLTGYGRVGRLDKFNAFVLDRNARFEAVIGDNVVLRREDEVLGDEEAGSSLGLRRTIRTFELGFYKNGMVAGIDDVFFLVALKAHSSNVSEFG